MRHHAPAPAEMATRAKPKLADEAHTEKGDEFDKIRTMHENCHYLFALYR